MCGICGAVNIDRANPDAVCTMVAALDHRGPDDRGVWSGDHVALGHTRLSILDLSPLGHQPMTDDTGRWTLTFNGEIYNHADLKPGLLKRGCRFRGHSDTEVLLYAFREYGPSCLDMLQGMFAFALWDAERRELFMARDRVGKKPLYYTLSRHALAFASEVTALLRLPSVSRRLHPAAVARYLALQYVPGEQTAFEQVRRLPPGHFAQVRCERDGVRFTHGPYWQLPDERTPGPPVTGDERSSARDAEEDVEALLQDAVRVRLISDVPVGVFLSGGLDSSLVAAFAARVSSSPVRTFSVRFRDDRYDEHEFARSVATRLGAEHHELEADAVTPETFERVLCHTDEPLADPACVPTFQIAEQASRHVKVILSGEGADELFGGYPHYVTEERWSRWLALAQRAAPGASRWLAPWRDTSPHLRRGLRVLESPPFLRAARWTTVFSRADFDDFLSPAFRPAAFNGYRDIYAALRAALPEVDTGSPAERSMRADLGSWLPDDLLMKVDKMTMAHALEARAPYLDRRLVERLSGLGLEQKIDGTTTKVLLKRIAARHLPQEIWGRRKHGFEVPVAHWMTGALRPIVEDSLSASSLEPLGVFNGQRVQGEWRGLLAGSPRAYPRRLWVVFCLAAWMQRVGASL